VFTRHGIVSITAGSRSRRTGIGSILWQGLAMLIAIWPLLAAIVGLLIFVLATNAKVVEIGKALMWTGFLVSLFVVSHQTIRIG
jgi:hypothetical protein